VICSPRRLLTCLALARAREASSRMPAGAGRPAPASSGYERSRAPRRNRRVRRCRRREQIAVVGFARQSCAQRFDGFVRRAHRVQGDGIDIGETSIVRSQQRGGLQFFQGFGQALLADPAETQRMGKRCGLRVLGQCFWGLLRRRPRHRRRARSRQAESRRARRSCQGPELFGIARAPPRPDRASARLRPRLPGIAPPASARYAWDRAAAAPARRRKAIKTII